MLQAVFILRNDFPWRMNVDLLNIIWEPLIESGTSRYMVKSCLVQGTDRTQRSYGDFWCTGRQERQRTLPCQLTPAGSQSTNQQ